MTRTFTTIASSANDQIARASSVDVEQWLHMYQQMCKIRVFEENANELYTGAKMPGLTHLYIGQEAVAVGVCQVLCQDDFFSAPTGMAMSIKMRGADQVNVQPIEEDALMNFLAHLATMLCVVAKNGRSASRRRGNAESRPEFGGRAKLYPRAEEDDAPYCKSR